MQKKSAFSRLTKDYKELQEEPLPNANAVPSENDLFFWHGNIQVKLNIKGKKETAPIHFKIQLPEDYPKAAPHVGFCTEFPFTMGAAFTSQRDDKLKGLYVICLNLLGNLDNVHTEWISQVGEGWSPSMSITTLLVTLQSVFLDLDKQITESQKVNLMTKLNKFTNKIDSHQHTAQSPYPPIYSNKQLEEIKLKKQAQELIADGNFAYKEEIEAFLKDQTKVLTKNQKEQLYTLIHKIKTEAQANSTSNNQEIEEQKEIQKKKDQNSKLKKDIFCYISGASFEQEILGYGIYKQRNLISTFGDLISYSEFQNGCRQSSNKQTFQFFLPAFICPKHASNSNWLKILNTGIKEIGSDLGINGDTNDLTLFILPKLLNSMIVEMKNNSKAQAITFFEALCSFWRTLIFLYNKFSALKKKAVQMIQGFCNSEKVRHKDQTPDVGIILALFTTVSNEVGSQFFIDQYLDESFIRTVMWWNNGQPISVQKVTAQGVFGYTQVSRDLLIFQLQLINNIIGTDLDKISQEMDETYGKIPEQLEKFQQKIKSVKITNWKQFFQETGCSQDLYSEITSSVTDWIKYLHETSNSRGPRYKKSQQKRRY